MRFEPKILRRDDAPLVGNIVPDDTFELELPGDLGLLAAQLRDDAVHLSSLYPAALADEVAAPVNALPPRHSRRARWLWISAGTLASILLASVVALPWFLPGNSVKVPADLAAYPTADNEVLQPAGTQDVGYSTSPPAGTEAASFRELMLPTVAAPALFLQNVSGPELEGLFDLWEEDAVEQSRISI